MTVVKNIKSYVNVSHENMIWSVIGFALDADNLPVTNSLPALLAYINGLQTDMNMVRTLRASIVSTTTGITADNKALKRLLSVMSANIMGATYSFAVDSGNLTLAGEMKVTTTEMKEMKNQSFIDFVQRGLNAVTPIVGSLLSYGVTSAVVASWQTLLTQLSNQLIDPKNAIAFRKAVNSEVQTLLKGCMDGLYNNCDRIVLQLRDTLNAQYYLNYKANRKLYPTTLSTQVRVHVIDGVGLPVTSGVVFIIGTDRSASLDSKGYALIDYIPFGEHEVTATTVSGNITTGKIDFKMGKSVTLHLQVGVIPPPTGKTTARTAKTAAKTRAVK